MTWKFARQHIYCSIEWRCSLVQLQTYVLFYHDSTCSFIESLKRKIFFFFMVPKIKVNLNVMHVFWSLKLHTRHAIKSPGSDFTKRRHLMWTKFKYAAENANRFSVENIWKPSEKSSLKSKFHRCTFQVQIKFTRWHPNRPKPNRPKAFFRNPSFCNFADFKSNFNHTNHGNRLLGLGYFSWAKISARYQMPSPSLTAVTDIRSKM